MKDEFESRAYMQSEPSGLWVLPWPKHQVLVAAGLVFVFWGLLMLTIGAFMGAK